MEPVTHLLTGACLARSGLNRRAAYTTAAMTLAAEFPDIDTLWGFRGPVSGFEHHRGITHTFLGLPFEAALLVGVFVLGHQWRRRGTSPAKRSPVLGDPAAPVRWGRLYGFILLALLSHILLDYTNNYGVRPFFPFNPHWFAASLVFIFDPFIFVLLLAGLTLPYLFGLVNSEVGAKRVRYQGRVWARVALSAIVVLWLLRAYEHGRAVTLAQAQNIQLPAPASSGPAQPDDIGGTLPATVDSLPVGPSRSLANPDPLSIFRWYTASDFGPAYRLGVADTGTGVFAPGELLLKPKPTAMLTAAKESRLGRIYLDWSSMPWITASDTPTSASGANDQITVTFQDLRFLGSSPSLLRGRATPLTGTVLLRRSGEVAAQGMDGRFEH